MQDCIADGTVGRGTYLSIRTAAKVLEISVSAFYQWRQSDYLHPHGVVHTDDRILTEVKAIINEHPTNEIPGVRVIYDNLQSKNIAIGFKRLRRLMRESGIYHRFHRQYVKTTDSDHNLPRCPNLLDRRFNDFGINEAWCGDITYLPTDEGWLYLASVIDLGTRRLVGYCFSKRMTTDIVMNALRMAYNNERPSEGCIFHSDQGSQYCSHAFQQELVEHAFRPSMSRLGQCWDNAPAEAFWAILKRECVPSKGSFKTRTEAMLQCTKWIRYYNLKRPHSTLGMKSPYKYWLDLMACR